MMPGMDPRQMAKMMKQFGVAAKELEVKKVIFEFEDKRLIFKSPQVVEIKMQGQKSYQVVGSPEEEEKISEKDIELITEQTGCSKDEAVEALKESKGDIAEAILKIQEKKEK